MSRVSAELLFSLVDLPEAMLFFAHLISDGVGNGQDLLLGTCRLARLIIHE